MNEGVKVYTDGGARGNPGPSACAFVVIVAGNIIKKGSSYLGEGTNNQAEYKGVLLALNWLRENTGVIKSKKIEFFLDSELVTRQLTGQYKIRDQKLKRLALKAKKLENLLGMEFNYTSVKREKNKLADKLVNEELDDSI